MVSELEIKHDNSMSKVQSEHIKATALLKQDLANTIKILKVINLYCIVIIELLI